MRTEAQRIYNSLFPYSVEVCALTQLHQLGAKPGGWGGHATLFINGAEIDSGASYPRLRLVSAGTDLSDSNAGTGISVNKIFDNVAWVAIPGRDEFFRGGLAPSQVLDRESYKAAIRHAIEAGWFSGIRVKDAVMRGRSGGVPEDEFIVRQSIGTDFALTFARTAYSARLPMSRERIARVIVYLNAVNETAQKSGYTWNMYANNCSHVVHNALAAAGVWDTKVARGGGPVDVARDVASVAKALVLRRMSDFSFPANTFVRLYEAGNERPVDDAVAAFRSHDVRRTMREGWMTTGPGALISTYPIHEASRNRLFVRGRDPFLFSVPMLWDKADKYGKLTRDVPAVLTDVAANLAHAREGYAKTLASQRSLADELGRLNRRESQDAFRAFHGRFYDQIADELRRTDVLLLECRRLAS